MSGSTGLSKRFLALIALVAVLAVGSAYFLFSKAKPAAIPVTGGASPASAQSSFALDYVDRLALNSAKSAAIPVTGGASPASVQSSFALDYVDRLALNSAGNKAPDPVRQAPLAPMLYDLGSGYILELYGANSRIISPAVLSTGNTSMDRGAAHAWSIIGGVGQNLASTVPFDALSARGAPSSIDLGAGYRLELSSSDSLKIVPPASSALPSAVPSAEQKLYIGGGYWLELGSQGGQVVPEGSK